MIAKDTLTTKRELEKQNRELRMELDRLRGAERPKIRRPKTKASEKFCPHCATVKPIREYGVRVVRGVIQIQSWCKRCRATTNYHNKPRRNRSVNHPDAIR